MKWLPTHVGCNSSHRADEEEQAPKNVPWLRAVLDTEPLGEHGAVLDVKWLGWKDDESVPGVRAHAMALLFWDRVIGSVLFHDPSCGCSRCA